MKKENWPADVIVPRKYASTKKVVVPFYVRQVNGPVEHEDRVIWASGVTAAKGEFCNGLKNRNTAYLYDLASIMIDPDCSLAQENRPEDNNWSLARKIWARRRKEQEMLSQLAGDRDADSGGGSGDAPAKRGRPKKQEPVPAEN